MRIAVISDIHANLPALESVERSLKSDAPDTIVVLGDISSKGAFPRECADRLFSADALMVRGNAEDRMTEDVPEPDGSCETFVELCRMEHWMRERLDERQMYEMARLPGELELETPQGTWWMYHATPGNPARAVLPWRTPGFLDEITQGKKIAKIVYAHVHHAFCLSLAGRLIVNSGSVGSPFDGDPRASYVLLDMCRSRTDVTVRRVEYNIALAVQAARQRGFPACDRYEHMLTYARYPW